MQLNKQDGLFSTFDLDNEKHFRSKFVTVALNGVFEDAFLIKQYDGFVFKEDGSHMTLTVKKI